MSASTALVRLSKAASAPVRASACSAVSVLPKRCASTSAASGSGSSAPAAPGAQVEITTLRGTVEKRSLTEVESTLAEINAADSLLHEAVTPEYIEDLRAAFQRASSKAEKEVIAEVAKNPLLKGSMEYETIGSAPLRLGRELLRDQISGSAERLAEDVAQAKFPNSEIGALPISEDLVPAASAKVAGLKGKALPESSELGLTDAQIDEILDFHHPPRLTYEHVKLLKNIDYSPLITAARSSIGMFTVSDVLPLVDNAPQEVADRLTDSGPDTLQPNFLADDTFDTMQGKLRACRFCRPDPSQDGVLNIHYSNVDLLRQYISSTGAILSRRVTGVCARHQRQLRFSIKNARFLSLLSYTSDWHVPYSYVNPTKYPAWADQQAGRDADLMERMSRKQVDLETVASLTGADRAAAVEAIYERKGITADYNPEIEAKLARLPPVLEPGTFLDRFAPPNARAPVADEDLDKVGDILEREGSPAMDVLEAKYKAEEAEGKDLFDPFWSDLGDEAPSRIIRSATSPEDEALKRLLHAANLEAEEADQEWVSDTELDYLREATATEQDDKRALFFRTALAAALRRRAAQTVNTLVADELREEVRQLGFPGSIEEDCGLPADREEDAPESEEGDNFDRAPVPSAEEVLRELGVDVDALVKADSGFDAVAWVERLRQIQAANKLRDTRNPYDQGERLEHLKALHRMGFTGPAKRKF